MIDAETIGYIAALAHEVNRIYCEAIGDKSQLSWKDAPDWQKESAISGVLYHLENRDATPESSHENWMKDKLADGWKFGPVKDPEKKEHPQLVEYANLPQDQKVKDYLFKGIVDLVANAPTLDDIIDPVIDNVYNL